MMEFWISGGNTNIQLPVPPAEFTLSTGQNNQVVTVTDFGEVNLWGQKKLDEIALESFFPAQRYAFVQSSTLYAPWEYVHMLDELRKSGNTCRLIITGSNINITCYIETFEYGVKDGTQDVWFNIALKEYRPVPAYVNSIYTGNSGSAVDSGDKSCNPPGAASSGQLYTVVKGDCLWNIAKKFYGKGSKWRKISNANKDKIKNPDRIYPGQQLWIP